MPDWLMQLGQYAVIAGAIYGGIRADIRNLHTQVKAAQDSAAGAHQRIDGILMKGAKSG